MPDRTTKDLRDAYKRRFMLHVCKDGTVSYRDVEKREKVFNGRALPVFSVDTEEEAKAIQARFCRLQYGSHPLMPGRSWYKLNEFSSEIEDLDRVRNEFAAFYQRMKERNTLVGQAKVHDQIAKKARRRGARR